ncbi:MAG: FtsH protease activity modulator HflK [Candidatus Aminicenantes bacterium]|nr:FtsH protease activity modulator HflK [Candidatus Aminicenantes bacterium]MDH5742916.1 FtsH protease activity modulator HflK [Candidatus Aminicenantes bacterium]
MSNDFPSMEIRLPKIKPGVIKIAIAAVIILILLFSSFYQISPEEMGVILRFGKFVRTTDPGLHLKFPGIEELIKVPVQRQLKLEFGFRTERAGIRTEYRVTPDSKKEATMLTGDLNVADVEWIVQYKIEDPYKYLFKIRDAESTFRYMNEAIVRKIVGDNSVDEVITVGRARMALEVKEQLQELCDLYEIGIEVNQLIFQDVNPPEPVKPSFNEVNEALQEKERKINEAWAEYNQEIPKAQGVAEQTIRGAEGYATERVNNAEGDANRFRAIYREYARAPLVTRKRLYLEAINDILPKMNKKIIFDEKQKNILPLLNLGEEVKK